MLLGVVLQTLSLLLLVVSVPVPSQVEIVVTPQDLKDAAEYAVVKIPEIKNNFKTMVKQKLLNRIISKDYQELTAVVDPITGKLSLTKGNVIVDGSHTKDSSISELHSDPPIQNIEIKIPQEPGLVTSIIKGGDTFETDTTDDESEPEENEHVGYKKPYSTKTIHKDMGIKGVKLEQDPFEDPDD
ncbi:uncharacterized protein RJT21DRAFT_127781 [Scheffersomyces amazonensis]|uniref:uncharacterized protein n=1 Tax=Scheffersomyces amazonensis TaxID=1078765 RepID=UPI00315CE172